MQISELWMSQRKLRNLPQVFAMIQEINEGGYLPPITIKHDTDGTLQLEDGHHRLMAYWLSGRRELGYGELLILQKDQWRPRFGKIEDLLYRCGITNRRT